MNQSSRFFASKTSGGRFSGCLAALIFVFFQPVAGQTAPAIVALDAGAAVERQIAGGEKNEFQIALAAGEYAKIIIEQRGINVFSRLLDADGKTLIETDAEQRSTGTETVELYTPVAANLRLTVAPRQKSDRRAAYQITLVERRAATDKEIALDEARQAFTAANALWIAGKYAEALPPAERALAIRLRELGAEHADVGRAYFTLGNVVGDQGDLVKNEIYYVRALEIAEKALGKDHLYVSSILNNWGVLHKLKGDYVKAETMYRRALEIREKNLEPNHLWIASSLNNLGTISNEKGDSEKAAAYYRRALTIRENALGPEHPDVATSLNNLANLTDDFAVVEPLHLRVLAIREKILGSEHHDVGQTLYNLSRIYLQANDYAKSESFGRRSLAVFEKALGAEHPLVWYPLNLLGAVCLIKGDYTQSETLLLRAAALKEKTQSPLHPELGRTYTNLAALYAVRGETEKAAAAQKRANEILEYNTALNLTVGSEREKMQYLQTLTGIEYKTLTLNFQAAKPSEATTELAVTSVLRRKGRVLDAMSDSFAALRRRADRQDQKLFDDLNKVSNELVAFVMDGGRGITPDEYRRQIKTLEQKREAVEIEISRRNLGFYEPLKSVTLDEVRAAIPEKTALVEYAVYHPISFTAPDLNTETSGKGLGAARYAAFVVGAKGETRGIELGTAEEINRLADDLRMALRDPKNKNVREKSRALDEKIMQPIRALVGDATHLLVSPDGGLNLIPFEALTDENSGYLIERYDLTYLSSGRDLLRMKTARTSKNKSLVVANPLFGAPFDDEIAANRPPKNTGKLPRRSVTAARNLSDTYFAPLGGTAQEARVIGTQFPDALILTGAQATETALKQTAAPQILHIATHGFFLQNTDDLPAAKNAGKTPTAAVIENPLLRSGLALAGANGRKSGADGDDGILTALEASGLNLWGTKLVVLSACDTGLGDVKNGEGVYGLRRALTLAGTETLVMSLWQVSDAVTRELMTNYYVNLKNGAGRGAALRQAQLEMMKKPGRAHPFYWAAFIQSGEWANLEGKR